MWGCCIHCEWAQALQVLVDLHKLQFSPELCHICCIGWVCSSKAWMLCPVRMTCWGCINPALLDFLLPSLCLLLSVYTAKASLVCSYFHKLVNVHIRSKQQLKKAICSYGKQLEPYIVATVISKLMESTFCVSLLWPVPKASCVTLYLLPVRLQQNPSVVYHLAQLVMFCRWYWIQKQNNNPHMSKQQEVRLPVQ